MYNEQAAIRLGSQHTYTLKPGGWKPFAYPETAFDQLTSALTAAAITQIELPEDDPLQFTTRRDAMSALLTFAGTADRPTLAEEFILIGMEAAGLIDELENLIAGGSYEQRREVDELHTLKAVYA